MRHYAFFIAGLCTTLSACNTQPDPASCFNMSANESYDKYQTFSFTDCSMNADSYVWDFGDGHTSTDQNPTHAYNQWGNYRVTLTTENDQGQNTFTQYIKIGKPRLVSGQVVSYVNNILDPDSVWTYMSTLVNPRDIHIASAPESGSIGPINSISALGTRFGHFDMSDSIRLYIKYSIGNGPGKPNSFLETHTGAFLPDILQQKEYQGVVFQSDTLTYVVDLTFELDVNFSGE